jgi:hypothetical protein
MRGVQQQPLAKKTLWVTLVLGGLVVVFGLIIYYISLYVRRDHPPVSPENAFRFEVAGITPLDDESIKVQVVEDQVEIANPDEWKNAEKIYVSIVEHEGIARVNTVSMYDPENADFIEASAKSISIDSPFIMKIAYPFEKVLLHKLPSGEFDDAYWDLLNKTDEQVTALVRIRSGHAVVLDILIGDRSIREVAGE